MSYLIITNKAELGPYTPEQILVMYKNGSITSDSFVRNPANDKICAIQKFVERGRNAKNNRIMFVIFSIILVIGGFYFFVAYNSSPPRSAIQTTESFKSEERWNRIMSSVSMIAVILGIASFMASRNQKITID